MAELRRVQTIRIRHWNGKTWRRHSDTTAKPRICW